MYSQVVTRKPIEVVASILMVVSGIALTSSGSTILFSGLGAALASMGGALLSWSAATVQEDERAIRFFRPRLETLSRHLGTIAAQINQITVDARNESIEPNAALSLVSTTSNNLYTLVNDVQAMIGSDFDLAGIQGTISRLGELASLWSESAHGSSAAETTVGLELQERFADQLAEIKDQLQTAVRVGGPPRRHAEEKFPCPKCTLKVKIAIGSEMGATAAVTCPKCKLRFNVHRNSNHRLFYRVVGESPQLQSRSSSEIAATEIECGVCERKQSVELGKNPGSSAHRRCINCGVGLNIHRVSPHPDKPALVVRDGLGAINSPELLHERYRRILKKTGVRLVPREVLELGCREITEVFSKGKATAESFQDLDKRLLESMNKEKPELTLTDAKKVRQMVFKSGIFIFEPGESGKPKRIGILDDVDEATILERTDEQLLRRVVQQREEPLNPEAAARALLGHLPEDNERMASIVRRINSLWDAGDLEPSEEPASTSGEPTPSVEG